MAETIFIKKIDNSLVASDWMSQECIDEMREWETVKAVITRPRNLKHHKLFFALLHKVFQNQEFYKTEAELRYAISMALGYVKEVKIKGQVGYMPVSISFANMGQKEFDQFFDDVIRFVRTQVIPGIEEESLRKEIEEMI